ncbi:MAG: YfiR family protein [Acidobacteriota bacterium]
MALGFGALLLMLRSDLRAEAAIDEYQVKAAFLYNFAKFVEWPVGAFAQSKERIVIGLFRDDPFHGLLDEILRGKTAHGRAFQVRKVRDVKDIEGCHILFFPASSPGDVSRVAGSTGIGGILTVGEQEHFAEEGGMINFVMANNRVRFEINPDTIQRSGLKVSSRLLSLAHLVQRRPSGN